ncbi:hypothetical protein COP2_004030 [Malus domestica]
MDKAMNRQRVLLQHLRPNSSVSSSNFESVALSASICAAGNSAAYHRTAAFGDDVVIVAVYRTAICKAKRGGFKDTLPDDLLAPVLKEVIERTNLNPSEVGDIVVGTVRAPGSLRATECRMAAFYASFPGKFSTIFEVWRSGKGGGGGRQVVDSWHSTVTSNPYENEFRTKSR